MPLGLTKRKLPALPETLRGFSFAPCLAIAAYNVLSYVAPHFLEPKTTTLYISMVTILILVALDRFVTYDMRMAKAATFITCALFAGCCAVSFGLAPAFCVAGDIASGIGRGAIIVLLGLYLCSIPLAHSLLTLAGGFALYSFFMLFDGVLIVRDSAACTFAGAIIAAVCLAWGFSHIQGSRGEAEKAGAGASAGAGAGTGTGEDAAEVSPQAVAHGANAEQTRVAWLLLLVPIVLLIVLNLVTELGFSEFGERSRSHEVWFVVQTTVLLFAILWLVVLKRTKNTPLLCFFCAPILLVPLAAVFFMQFDQQSMADLILDIRRASFSGFWALLLVIAKRSGKPPVAVFGLGHFLSLQVPRTLVGGLLPLMSTFEQNTLFLITYICVFAVVFLLLLFLFLAPNLLGKRVMGDAAGGRKRDAANGFGDEDAGHTQAIPHKGGAVKRFCATHGLSEREMDVVKLLVRGYSYAEIGKRLMISPETVRSHAKKIYPKIGVGNKQELLAALEEFCAKE